MRNKNLWILVFLILLFFKSLYSGIGIGFNGDVGYNIFDAIPKGGGESFKEPLKMRGLGYGGGGVVSFLFSPFVEMKIGFGFYRRTYKFERDIKGNYEYVEGWFNNFVFPISFYLRFVPEERFAEYIPYIGVGGMVSHEVEGFWNYKVINSAYPDTYNLYSDLKSIDSLDTDFFVKLCIGVETITDNPYKWFFEISWEYNTTPSHKVFFYREVTEKFIREEIYNFRLNIGLIYRFDWEEWAY